MSNRRTAVGPARALCAALSLAAVLALAGDASAQYDPPPLNSLGVPNGGPAVPTPPAKPGSVITPEGPVLEIRVIGNRGISTKKVLDAIETRLGRAFDQSIFEKDVRKLASKGWFLDVRPSSQQAPNGVIVTFEVAERPTLQYVKYLGNKKYKEKTLAKQTELKKGAAADPYAVEEGRRKLDEYYKGKGFNNVQVSIMEGNKTGDRGAIYLINEGPLQKISNVHFEGNTIATDGRLRTQIQSKKPILWLFKGMVDRKKIDEDLERITAYYRGLGFFDAKVGRELEFNEKQNWLTLTFVINEGIRYRVRDIRLEGNTKFQTAQLTPDLKLKSGEYFDQAKMNRDKETFKDMYGSQGYVFADVQPENRLYEEPGTLDVVYKISEGDRYRVGEINVHILGDNPHTRHNTVYNRLSLRPGDIVDTRQLRASERRLKASSLFLNDPQKGTVPKIAFSPPGSEDDESEARIAKKRRSRGGSVRGQSPDSGVNQAAHWDAPRSQDRVLDLNVYGEWTPEARALPDEPAAAPNKELAPEDKQPLSEEASAEPLHLTRLQGARVAANRPALGAKVTETELLTYVPSSFQQRFEVPPAPPTFNGPTYSSAQRPVSGGAAQTAADARRQAVAPVASDSRALMPTAQRTVRSAEPSNSAVANTSELAAQPTSVYARARTSQPAQGALQPGGSSLSTPIAPAARSAAPTPGPAGSNAARPGREQSWPASEMGSVLIRGQGPGGYGGQIMQPPPQPYYANQPPNGAPASGNAIWNRQQGQGQAPAYEALPGGGQPQFAPGQALAPGQAAPPALPSVLAPVGTDPNQPPDQYLPLDVYATETQTGRFMFGVGVNSNAGVVGSIVLDEQNFDWRRVPRGFEDFRNGTAFRGAGQKFRLEAAPGTQLQRYMFNFSEPYLFDTPVSFGLSGFYYTRQFYDWVEARLGGTVNYGYQFTPDLGGSIGLGAQQVTISQPRVLVPELQAVLGSTMLYSAKANIVHDTRDNTFLATEGHYIALSFEQDFGSFVFPRATVDMRKYFLLHERPDASGRHVLSTIGHFGIAGKDVPIYDRFFAGGFSTIRGFQFRGASPVDNTVVVGGDLEAYGTAEYLFPITADDMLRGVAFIDVGTVQNLPSSPQVQGNAFRASPGFGLRITVPAMGPAPIAVDFAFPVASAATDHKQIFSFFVGFGR